MSIVTHYDILGLTQQASVDDIRNNYKKLALKYHPDNRRWAPENSKEICDEIWKRINAAHTALTDIRQRHVYDSYLDQNQPVAYGSTFVEILDENGFGTGEFRFSTILTQEELIAEDAFREQWQLLENPAAILQKLKALQKSLKYYTDSYQQSIEERGRFYKQLRDKGEEIFKLLQENTSLKQQNTTLTSDNTKLSQQNQILAAKNSDFEQRLNTLQTVKTRNDFLEQQFAPVQATNDQLVTANHNLTNENLALKQQLALLQLQIQKEQQERDKIVKNEVEKETNQYLRIFSPVPTGDKKNNLLKPEGLVQINRLVGATIKIKGELTFDALKLVFTDQDSAEQFIKNYHQLFTSTQAPLSLKLAMQKNICMLNFNGNSKFYLKTIKHPEKYGECLLEALEHTVDLSGIPQIYCNEFGTPLKANEIPSAVLELATAQQYKNPQLTQGSS